MFVYARLSDYARMKNIDLDILVPGEEQLLRDQLRRASRYVDRNTKRWFYPRYQVRQMDVPVNYYNLANRVQADKDLGLGQDLLQAVRLQTDTGSRVDTNETVEAGGISSLKTTLTVSDADGTDANGNTRFNAGDVLRIDNEQMLVRKVDTATNIVTVDRGSFDTSAETHDAGTTIEKLVLNNRVPGIDFRLLDYNLSPKYGIRLIWPNWWTGGYVSSRGRFPSPQIFIEGWWGFHRDIENMWINTNETVQTGGILAATTELEVSDADGKDDWYETRFEKDDMIQIEDELMRVIDVNATPEEGASDTITVLRGREGTLAVDHEVSLPIYRFAVDDLVRGVVMTIAKTWRESDESVGGRQGVSEISTGVALTLPADIAEQIKLLKRRSIG